MLKIILAILLAALLWNVTFAIRPFNFWLMMSLSTLVLISVSFAFNKSVVSRKEINLKNITVGVNSAAVLYVIFRTGNHFLICTNRPFPEFLRHRMGKPLLQDEKCGAGTCLSHVMGCGHIFHFSDSSSIKPQRLRNTKKKQYDPSSRYDFVTNKFDR